MLAPFKSTFFIISMKIVKNYNPTINIRLADFNSLLSLKPEDTTKVLNAVFASLNANNSFCHDLEFGTCYDTYCDIITPARESAEAYEKFLINNGFYSEDDLCKYHRIFGYLYILKHNSKDDYEKLVMLVREEKLWDADKIIERHKDDIKKSFFPFSLQEDYDDIWDEIKKQILDYAAFDIVKNCI